MSSFYIADIHTKDRKCSYITLGQSWSILFIYIDTIA